VTVAAYMIAGRGTPDQAPARFFAYAYPSDFVAPSPPDLRSENTSVRRLGSLPIAVASDGRVRLAALEVELAHEPTSRKALRGARPRPLEPLAQKPFKV